MKVAFTALLALLISFSALAQDNAKTKDMKKLLELTGAVKVGIQMMNTSIEAQRQTNPNIPQEFWDEFMKQITEDAFVEMVMPIYDKHYTHPEIQELIAFYQTPVGKKTITVLPLIAQESMEAGQKLGMQIAQNIIEKMKADGKL